MSLKEAFRYYKKFLKRSPEMCLSPDFSLHHTDNPLYDEGEYPLEGAGKVGTTSQKVYETRVREVKKKRFIGIR